jgi:hypothetical protein
MEAFINIQKNLKNSNLEVVAKELGYKSKAKGAKSLQKFLDTKNLSFWLQSGFYDFKYRAIEFYENLAKLYGITKEEIAQDLKNAKLYKQEYDSFNRSYIFVNTNFRRKNEPIFVLSILELQRRLILKRENLMFKSDKEIFKKISKFVRRHYKSKGGKLVIWGEIENYQYHHRDGKVYLFDVVGNYIPNKQVYESQATLRLK